MTREKQMKFNVGTFSVEFDMGNTVLQEFERISIEEKVIEAFESHGIRIKLIGWGEKFGGMNELENDSDEPGC